MNFKPNLWKTIVSILLIIIVDFILANSGKVVCMLAPGGTCTQQFWYEHIFDFGVVLISIIAGLIIYIIWSLFEENRKRKR